MSDSWMLRPAASFICSLQYYRLPYHTILLRIQCYYENSFANADSLEVSQEPHRPPEHTLRTAEKRNTDTHTDSGKLEKSPSSCTPFHLIYEKRGSTAQGKVFPINDTTIIKIIRHVRKKNTVLYLTPTPEKNPTAVADIWHSQSHLGRSVPSWSAWASVSSA